MEENFQREEIVPLKMLYKTNMGLPEMMSLLSEVKCTEYPLNFYIWKLKHMKQNKRVFSIKNRSQIVSFLVLFCP